jgi:hypothetical protein
MKSEIEVFDNIGSEIEMYNYIMNRTLEVFIFTTEVL